MRGWIALDFKNSILLGWRHEIHVSTGLLLEEKGGLLEVVRWLRQEGVLKEAYLSQRLLGNSSVGAILSLEVQ